MEALEKIMGSEFIYLDIWYLNILYLAQVQGKSAREAHCNEQWWDR